MTRRFASALIKSGLRPDDCMALILPNIPEFPIAFLGANAAGLVCTLINPQYTLGKPNKPRITRFRMLWNALTLCSIHCNNYSIRFSEEIKTQLLDANAKAVVTISLFVPLVRAAMAYLPNLKSIIVIGEAEAGCHTFGEMVKDDGSAFPQIRLRDPKTDLAALPYSSGTTGKPKGTMLTHFNMVANIVSCIHPDWCSFRETTCKYFTNVFTLYVIRYTTLLFFRVCGMHIYFVCLMPSK